MPRFHTAPEVDNQGHEPAGGEAHRSRGRLVAAVVRRHQWGHGPLGRRRFPRRPVRLGGEHGPESADGTVERDERDRPAARAGTPRSRTGRTGRTGRSERYGYEKHRPRPLRRRGLGGPVGPLGHRAPCGQGPAPGFPRPPGTCPRPGARAASSAPVRRPRHRGPAPQRPAPPAGPVGADGVITARRRLVHPADPDGPDPVRRAVLRRPAAPRRRSALDRQSAPSRRPAPVCRSASVGCRAASVGCRSASVGSTVGRRAAAVRRRAAVRRAAPFRRGVGAGGLSARAEASRVPCGLVGWAAVR
jgi:hypothetical protein